MNNLIVTPVGSSLTKPAYPKPLFPDTASLTLALKRLGVNLCLGKTLKGGTVSQVYRAKLNGQNVVVKHTEDLTPFDPTEIFISRKGHNQDAKILQLLEKSKNVRVPKVIRFFPEITTTIMEDLGEKGYRLLSEAILNHELPTESAEKIGTTLAGLAEESRKWKKFTTNESARQSIYERGLELRLAYPNSQEQYLFLEQEFTKNNQYWTWPDGHPKNIFVNSAGEPVFIDFGRSVWADQQFVLPNFLAHIAVYSLAGYLPLIEAAAYIESCIQAYRFKEEIDEKIFCQYFGMEILHRASGKWLAGIDEVNQKLAIFKFGLTIFDDRVTEIQKLIMSFKKDSC